MCVYFGKRHGKVYVPWMMVRSRFDRPYGDTQLYGFVYAWTNSRVIYVETSWNGEWLDVNISWVPRNPGTSNVIPPVV